MRFLSILVASLFAAALLSGCFGDEHDHEENGGTTTTTTTTGTTNTTTPPGANRPPVADFTFTPDQPVAGENVTFDANASSDPDGDSLAYDWDFDDDSTGSGVGPVHVFADDGAYNVTLTVTDPSEASDTKTVQIIVLAGSGTVSNNVTFNETGELTTPNPLWEQAAFRNTAETRDAANDTAGDTHTWFELNVNGTPSKLVLTIEYPATGSGFTISPVLKAFAYPPNWGTSTQVDGNTDAKEIADPVEGKWNICVAMTRQNDPTLPEVGFFLNVTAAYPAE